MAPARVQVVAAEYAVRGEIVIRADKYQQRLREGDTTLPFDEVVSCNIGNPQALRQKPITFFRQVLSLCTFPELLDNPDVAKMFPSDAIARARNYMSMIGGGTGAYSHSMGVQGVRKEVADYIEARDGYQADADKIFLTDGASSGVQMSLRLAIADPADGIMVPIPQYPLYSATIALEGGRQVDYYLDESKGWTMSVAELERAYDNATAQGTRVKGLVVINPGNPTGQCLDEANMRDIVSFCNERKVALMADEVYQTNIYSNTPFTAFRKVVCDMAPSETADLSLFSFHSVSKGFLGECGRRGGYFEVYNVDEDVQEQLYKLASVTLCSNLDGQIMTGLMVNPPRQGDESYALYETERKAILDSLKSRSQKLVQALDGLDGISCNVVEGALYAFPSITLSDSAVKAAAAEGKAPDAFYCTRLLDETGIVVVPGSGFGQKPNTFHFRTTILPPDEQMDAVIDRLGSFHKSFVKQYS